MHHPTDRITHTTAFVTPVVEHWLEQEIAQWVHLMKDRSDNPPQMSERSTSELHPAPHTGLSRVILNILYIQYDNDKRKKLKYNNKNSTQ